ncbi:MAG: alkaline phosphatase family protein [Acidobacteriota bacterium]
MTRTSSRPRSSFAFRCAAAALAAMQTFATAPILAQTPGAGNTTTTPIKHVIIILGENRTFDHVFATYQPRHGQHVLNLLSEGIIDKQGNPGPSYSLSAQYQAVVTGSYTNAPQDKSIYAHIPPLLVGGPKNAPFSTVAAAEAVDPDLASGYEKFLTTGGTGQTSGTVDMRLPNNDNLNEGVYQLSPGISFDDYAASPVHRFFQMWQQADCSTAYSTVWDPAGCRKDLFPWVEVSVGAGSNGKQPPTPFTDMSTGEGSVSMGFFNMAAGDAAYLKQLADEYTISDNYHQAVMGGTGANHIYMGYADDLYYSDGKGTATTPPSNQIENPNPQPNTNNYYTQDGYSGGSYVNCYDNTQPGVAPIANYLNSLDHPIQTNCQAGHYYIVNNYNPGYLGNGALGSTTSAFTIPPSSVRGIADDLMDHNVSFRWYGEDWNLYVNDPTESNPADAYCNICNFLQYSTRIMTNPTLRSEHIADESQLFTDLSSGNLPAVSWVKPSGFNDGHPASSKLDIFEGFTKKIIDALQANPKLWASTAVFVTVDEGGGYYDSGYIQPLDFFGDGTRIPLIVVSPYSRGGRVVHEYSDHVSTLKFIEKNWNLPPITNRSRDNMPDPVATRWNPYVPTNGPAIDDLMSAFNFNQRPDRDHDHDHDHDGGRH